VTCFYCGAAAVDWHHPTWRLGDGRYADPHLVIPACHDCHVLAGDDARTAQVTISDGQTVLEQVVVFLRSLGCCSPAFRPNRGSSSRGHWPRLSPPRPTASKPSSANLI